MIDTGAPNVVLDPGFAHDLELTTTDAGTGMFAGGKTAAMRRAALRSISLDLQPPMTSPRRFYRRAECSTFQTFR
ncbi:MAG: aspartyl protease family protein [Candidatus Eremiobacteraeota bacterium]|nr:aspartyl protease family protein [Candidatus Eremiobacteraeota bacterium]MBC5803251.1 aspartyl protease family protein [Candidatus Eremiobacteraeota bacterium]MBC5822272.1 aspartyl protease family protein [Candidatus Eremiobacteraeota bacterium]